jgi:hypothetical protein
MSILVGGCICNRANELASTPDLKNLHAFADSFQIDRNKTEAAIREFTAAPHPFGSERQAAVRDYIEGISKSSSQQVFLQTFTSATPNPSMIGEMNPQGPREITIEKSGTNIYALAGIVKEPTCVILLGSHYDTKIVPGIDYVGANDSASSSVLLLDLLRHLHQGRTKVEDLTCDLMMVWFDGEEAVLENWNDGEHRHPARIIDNTYGSRYATSQLTMCGERPSGAKANRCLPKELGGQKVAALVLLDMIGSPNLRLTRDSLSSKTLIAMLERTLASMGKSGILSEVANAISDDHVPFIRLGIPSINLINFEDLKTWHKPGDEFASLSLESIELAGKIALSMALQVAANPKEL